MTTQQHTGTVIFTRLQPMMDGTRITRITIRTTQENDGPALTRFSDFSTRSAAIAQQLESGEIASGYDVTIEAAGETLTAIRAA